MSSRPESDTDTQFNATLTRQRSRLRNLHDARNPPARIPYRGHVVKAENPEHPDHDAYELRNQNGDVLVTGERSDFANADDWVRYFDYAINQSPEKAREWLDEHLDGWWSQ